MEEPALHVSVLYVHTEKTKSYLYQIVPWSRQRGLFLEARALIHRIHVLAVASFCEGNRKQNNAVIGQVPCGALWVISVCEQLHVTCCHLAGSAQERPQEQSSALPCLCIKAFSCKYTNAVRLGGWAAARGVYHLEEYL